MARVHRTLFILQNAWNPSMTGQRQNLWFYINPRNHTGKRLHSMVDEKRVVVSNVNPVVTRNASGKGSTDMNFVLQVLLHVERDYTVVCGSQAHLAMCHPLAAKLLRRGPFVAMPHPSRVSNNMLSRVREAIENKESNIKFKPGPKCTVLEMPFYSGELIGK